MFLQLKNTNIGYKNSLISGIDTSLKSGDVCLMIGNNGVGKTTLIKSVLNQIPTLGGEILIDDKDVKRFSVKEISEKIAVVFSKYSVPANYKVPDLVALGKYIHYPFYFNLNKTDKQEVMKIIKDLNLEEYNNFPLNQLSDGNLQKVFVGRALAQNSPVIILDEPTTHLDEENKIMILKLLKNLAKKHDKLILFSSHDWRLAKEFADKIWYIKNQTLFSGSVEDVLFQHEELTKRKF
ncbi:MAG: ABC transporter ATP-binding protein [Flavobacteriaceae bacterium]|jgi:iron complex transport system ATP-binding protein|nr:ABC transporter ATP-binding protein [Flavobacteriaceae bacterium]